MVLRICTHHHTTRHPMVLQNGQYNYQANNKENGNNNSIEHKLKISKVSVGVSHHSPFYYRNAPWWTIHSPTSKNLFDTYTTKPFTYHWETPATTETVTWSKKSSSDLCKDESVLVKDQRWRKQLVLGRIVRQKGPVTYSVQVGAWIRFCHVDHLLKTGIYSSVVEEDEVIDLPSFDQINEGGEVRSDETLDNESGTV